jgi:hypothetical protein
MVSAFDLKVQHVAESAKHLHQFELKGITFLEWTATCDDMWVHYFTPESKLSSMEWHHKGPLPPKESKTKMLAGPRPSTNGEVINYCREANLALVLEFDANFHHVMWKSSDVSSRGRHCWSTWVLWITTLRTGAYLPHWKKARNYSSGTWGPCTLKLPVLLLFKHRYNLFSLVGKQEERWTVGVLALHTEAPIMRTSGQAQRVSGSLWYYVRWQQNFCNKPYGNKWLLWTKGRKKTVP